MTDDTLRTPDGQTLHLHHWPIDRPRARVLIVHGLGEHIGRYAHVAAALNAARFAVSGYDHRGHGRSTGPRGVVPAEDSLVADLAQVIDRLRADALPLVLLGHSMGGGIAARFVAESLSSTPAGWHRPVDALVLSSPALALPMNAVQKALLAVLGGLAPNLAVGNGLDAAWISRDPTVVQAYRDDPLVHDRVAGRLVKFLRDAGERARADAPRWRTPTLLLFGGSDRCVDPAGSRAFAAAAPKAVVESQEYPALAHEIFNEPEQREVLARLTDWLARRFPAQAPAPADTTAA